MPPHVSNTPTGVLFEKDADQEDVVIETPKEKYKMRIVWRNAIIFAYLHLAALYGAYLLFTSAKLITAVSVSYSGTGEHLQGGRMNVESLILMRLGALVGDTLRVPSHQITLETAYMMYIFGGIGITAGAHRLWAHKAYNAKWPLQVILMVLNTIAFQDAVIDWARDHRVHHKYSETNADPYNAKRGFFFAHIGWLLCRKHPDIKEKGKGVDISDLEKNPILAFQKRYYIILVLLLCFVLPTVVPVLCWNETWSNAFFVPTILRYVVTLNSTWLVNSAAHLYGNKPYDKIVTLCRLDFYQCDIYKPNINDEKLILLPAERTQLYNRFIGPSENFYATFATGGEGWHNYHHVFPWDYKTSELGKFRLNVTTALIDFFAKIGWAYNLKMVPSDIVQKRVERTGDGSHEVWGWGDTDQAQEDRDRTVVMHSLKKD